MLEGFAFEQLHGDERLAIVLADFVDRADVRMIQPGSGAGFALEALESLLILGHGFRQKLQRHHAPQFCVFGFEDHTHPAAAELFDDAIVGDFGTGEGIGIRHGGAS